VSDILANLIHVVTTPASFKGWPGGFAVSGPWVLSIPVFIAYFVFFIASVIWIFRDAKLRGKNGLVALIFILVTGWPISFLWWFWLRPPARA
jgi:hypothetical protein